MEWARQDRGTISDEDVIERISLRVPERLHYAVRDFARRENRDILLVEGIEDLLADLKMAGYKVFLLSNTSGGFHRFWPKVGVDKWFDDTMISADEGLVKPDLAFFRLACDRFRIRPEESVFIDDTPMNVEAAEYVGMSGFLFHGDIRELRDWLEETGAALQGGEPINRKNVDTAMTIRVMTVSDYDKVYDLWMSCRNMGFNNLERERIRCKLFWRGSEALKLRDSRAGGRIWMRKNARTGWRSLINHGYY